MPDYTPSNSKLSIGYDYSSISRRNIAILAMWLGGLGIPESLHEFVIAVFVSGNWSEVEEDRITLKRMARNISAGSDADRSITRAYERLKKSCPRFFDWQGEKGFEVIGRRVEGERWNTEAHYTFPHYQVLVDLFNLPENLNQRQIRAKVEQSLQAFPLQETPPKGERRRTPETVARAIAKSIEELLTLTGSPGSASAYMAEAIREKLGDEVLDEISKHL